ncbi:MAG: hypothetical protein ACLSVD_10950 [Eggerthellaceae bacterium]
MAVCPTGAAYIGADGIVGVDRPLHRCLYAWRRAPPGCVRNEETGAVDKCRFCTVSAETTGTKMCSCGACLTGARMFGDLDDRKNLEGDRRDERPAHSGRPDQIQSILREVMSDVF